MFQSTLTKVHPPSLHTIHSLNVCIRVYQRVGVRKYKIAVFCIGEEWFLVLDNDGDYAELDKEAATLAIHAAATYKTEFELIIEHMPRIPSPEEAKELTVDWFLYYFEAWFNKGPDDDLNVWNKTEISPGALHIENGIATVATCYNLMRAEAKFNNEQIHIANSFASKNPMGGAGSDGCLAESFAMVATTDQVQYSMLGSRNDVRWSCILHPDGELEKAPTFISSP